MAFCTKCGTNIAEDSSFCPSCGTPVAPGAPSVAPVAAASSAAPQSKPNKAAIVIAVVAVVVVAALGAGGFTLFSSLSEKAEERREAEAEEAEEDAFETRKREQAEVGADFIAAVMTEDVAMLERCVTTSYDGLAEDYWDLGLPSDPDYDVETDWDGEMLTLTITNGWDELRVEFVSDGDEETALVSADFYFNDDYYQGDAATLELEDGRWVITEIDGTDISGWL